MQTHVKSIFDLELLSGDSAIKLCNFTDKFSGHVRALEALGQKSTDWSPRLTHFILTKLDKNTVRKWETNSIKIKIRRIEDLTTFLKSRLKILESVETAKIINTQLVGNSRQKRKCRIIIQRH